MRHDPGQRLLMGAKLAVLGSPIAHSKSPAIHAAAYDALGLDWRYGRHEVVADDLAAFLAAREDWRGFSLTMPLKEEARRLAATLDPTAADSGVVNTLLRVPGDDGRGAWAGFNTDVAGLAAAIAKAGLDPARTIVIGSGATAVSAILAARRLGARRVDVIARNMRAVADLVARFDGSREPGAGHELRVSGTRLGLDADAFAAQRRAEPPTLVISALPGPAAAQVSVPDALTAVPLFDVAYDPWPSPFAQRWGAAGGRAEPGIAMLVEQALVQVRIFVHGDPHVPLPDEAEVLRRMSAAGVAR